MTPEYIYHVIFKDNIRSYNFDLGTERDIETGRLGLLLLVHGQISYIKSMYNKYIRAILISLTPYLQLL